MLYDGSKSHAGRGSLRFTVKHSFSKKFAYDIFYFRPLLMVRCDTKAVPNYSILHNIFISYWLSGMIEICKEVPSPPQSTIYTSSEMCVVYHRIKWIHWMFSYC